MFDRTNIHWPLELVVRPEGCTDFARWDGVIRDLSASHDQFLAIRGPDIDSILLGGCDERQLENNLVLLRDKLLCVLQMDPPKGGYRETVSQVAEAECCHRQLAHDGEIVARVKLFVEPQRFKFDVEHLGDAGGFDFQDKTAGNAVPENYISAIKKGIHEARNSGVLHGFPIIGPKVCLLDGACDDGKFSHMAFEIAARTAFREACEKASPILLEPLIAIDLVTPEVFLREVIGDLNSRRGKITEMGTQGDARTVMAIAPAANMFGFSNVFAQTTQHRGLFSTEFSHYERAPSSPGSGPPWPDAGALIA